MVRISSCNDGERVNLLIFAVAAVVVRIEVPHQRALNDRPHRLLGGNAGRSDEREAADSPRLEGANRSARDAPQIVAGELFRRASADQQQAFGLQSGRLVQQICFKRAAGQFATGQQIGGNRLHRPVAGGEFELWLFLLF